MEYLPQKIAFAKLKATVAGAGIVRAEIAEQAVPAG